MSSVGKKSKQIVTRGKIFWVEMSYLYQPTVSRYSNYSLTVVLQSVTVFAILASFYVIGIQKHMGNDYNKCFHAS